MKSTFILVLLFKLNLVFELRDQLRVITYLFLFNNVNKIKYFNVIELYNIKY